MHRLQVVVGGGACRRRELIALYPVVQSLRCKSNSPSVDLPPPRVRARRRRPEGRGARATRVLLTLGVQALWSTSRRNVEVREEEASGAGCPGWRGPSPLRHCEALPRHTSLRHTSLPFRAPVGVVAVKGAPPFPTPPATVSSATASHLVAQVAYPTAPLQLLLLLGGGQNGAEE